MYGKRQHAVIVLSGGRYVLWETWLRIRVNLFEGVLLELMDENRNIEREVEYPFDVWVPVELNKGWYP